MGGGANTTIRSAGTAATPTGATPTGATPAGATAVRATAVSTATTVSTAAKAIAETATARLRGWWRGAGRMVGQEGGPQINNTQQSNNIVQHPLLDKNVPQCKDLNKLVLALLSIQSP